VIPKQTKAVVKISPIIFFIFLKTVSTPYN
jgi:hypothetical protein